MTVNDHPTSTPDLHRSGVDELGDALQALVRTLKVVRRDAQRHDVHYTSLRSLVVLEEGPHRVSEIAERLCEDVSTTSRRVSALADEGLVQKLPDPHDQRAQLVAMTADGGVVLDDVRARTAEALSRALAQWSAEDVGSVVAQLRRLNGDLEKWVDSARP